MKIVQHAKDQETRIALLAAHLTKLCSNANALTTAMIIILQLMVFAMVYFIIKNSVSLYL